MTASKEKISIVIPAYNAEDFIKRTVESIRQQTYTNWELLIVNDGSKDKTGDIIDELAFTDLKIIALHQENGGEVAARRTGVLNASGKWVMFVDADDVIPRDAIESLVIHADKADIIAGTMHVKRIDEAGDIVEDYIWQNKKEGLMGNLEYAQGILSYQVQMSACSKLYKRELFDHFEWCVDRTIRQNPDLLMNIGIGAMADKIFVTNRAVCYDYIIHTGSASTNGMMSQEAWFRLFDKIQHYITFYPESTSLFEAFCHFRLERMDSMLRHGVFNCTSDDNHVQMLLTDCKKCHLAPKEKQTLLLMQSNSLRKLFNWWQKKKRK